MTVEPLLGPCELCLTHAERYVICNICPGRPLMCKYCLPKHEQLSTQHNGKREQDRVLGSGQ